MRGGGRGGQGKDAWSTKYDNVHIYTTKNHHKASSKSKTSHFVLSIRRFRSLSKASILIKLKSKAHEFYEALHANVEHCDPTKKATLANCSLSLKTAWLVMHSPYLRHLSEMANGGCYASAMKQNLCRLLHPACLYIHNC